MIDHPLGLLSTRGTRQIVIRLQRYPEKVRDPPLLVDSEPTRDSWAEKEKTAVPTNEHSQKYGVGCARINEDRNQDEKADSIE